MNSTEYKGHLIVGDGTFGHKLIKPVGKGSVHASLRGSYTTASTAQRAIDYYIANVKENKVGKAEISG